MPTKTRPEAPLSENEAMLCPWCDAPAKEPLIEPGPVAGTVSLGFVGCCEKMKAHILGLIQKSGPAVPYLGL